MTSQKPAKLIMGDLTRTNPRNANKKGYFDFDHDVPINQHCDQTFRDFHREHSQ